jgi:hypothetical protein
MPLCGFNQEMLEGLEKFHRGLAEQLIWEVDEVEATDVKEILEVS